MSVYKLRRAAREDIKDIARYTAQEYGKTQRDRYLAGLNLAMESLAQFPNRGKSRENIKPGCYSHHYAMHVIFYRIHTGYIDILAVLHKRMLPENYLPK